jgi:hypothetical protein
MAESKNIEFVRLQGEEMVENELLSERQYEEVLDNSSVPNKIYLSLPGMTLTYGLIGTPTGVGKTRGALQAILTDQERSSDIDALLEEVDTHIRNLRRNAQEIAELRAKTRAVLAEIQVQK